jgi:hypothetical protein
MGSSNAGRWKCRWILYVSRHMRSSEQRKFINLQTRGNLDLPWIFPFIGSAQLEVFSVIASLLLFTTHIWVCSQVKERVLFASA